MQLLQVNGNSLDEVWMDSIVVPIIVFEMATGLETNCHTVVWKISRPTSSSVEKRF
jgi:hypothetical protein